MDGGPLQGGGTVQLGEGTHRVSCVHPASGLSAETTVEVRAGAARDLTCYTEHTIRATVKSVNGTSHLFRIRLNGVVAGDSRTDLRRPPGRYQVEAVRDGFTTEEGTQEVVIRPAFERVVHRRPFTPRATSDSSTPRLP